MRNFVTLISIAKKLCFPKTFQVINRSQKIVGISWCLNCTVNINSVWFFFSSKVKSQRLKHFFPKHSSEFTFNLFNCLVTPSPTVIAVLPVCAKTIIIKNSLTVRAMNFFLKASSKATNKLMSNEKSQRDMQRFAAVRSVTKRSFELLSKQKLAQTLKLEKHVRWNWYEVKLDEKLINAEHRVLKIPWKFVYHFTSNAPGQLDQIKFSCALFEWATHFHWHTSLLFNKMSLTSLAI